MAKGSVNDIIKICVGGQEFKTTRGTLMSDQNSMLAKMFESDLLGRVAAARDPDTGAYFIDRSPKYFESILNFLRTGEIECPCCLDLKFLLQEADYYGIEGIVIYYWVLTTVLGAISFSNKLRDFLSGFFRLAHLALQNVNKDLCNIFVFS